jgi:hypothetical protein
LGTQKRPSPMDQGAQANGDEGRRQRRANRTAPFRMSNVAGATIGSVRRASYSAWCGWTKTSFSVEMGVVVWLVATPNGKQVDPRAFPVERTVAPFGAQAEHNGLGDPAPRASHLSWHGGESEPRQHFDDRRGRWSDAGTHGHSSHGPSHNRAANPRPPSSGMRTSQPRATRGAAGRAAPDAECRGAVRGSGGRLMWWYPTMSTSSSARVPMMTCSAVTTWVAHKPALANWTVTYREDKRAPDRHACAGQFVHRIVLAAWR